MTTARERYEQKTKVITYRVSNEFYDQIEEIKAKTGLSNANLIKLGAGIASEEIKKIMVEASDAGAKLYRLRTEYGDEIKRFDQERLLRRQGLDVEIQVLTLLAAGWHIEEVVAKLKISNKQAIDILKKWDKLEADREITKRELLRIYLKKHMDRLKDRRFYATIDSSSTEEYLTEKQDDIDYYQFLLNNPSEISEEEKEFLTAEYS